MSAVVRFLWIRLYRLLCANCGRVIWPWQARHRFGHTACYHERHTRAYAIAKANYGVAPWPCPECGWLP